jgi:hypothetical protein
MLLIRHARPTLLAVLLLGLGGNAALADTLSKSKHTLWNPTPRSEWRAMSADRPDFTESPYTVDAGAFQLEMSFVDYSRTDDAESTALAPINFKVGLRHDMDIQFVMNPFVISDDGTQKIDGIGDTQIRLKMNLWGNDSESDAFAFMPFVQIPTSTNGIGGDKIEGGLIFPYATSLSETVGLGLMFETDFVHNETEDNYDVEYVGTGVFGFGITDVLGLYVEGIGILRPDADREFTSILGIGVTYEVATDTVLDAGCNFGLEGDADDFNFFTGISIRY